MALPIYVINLDRRPDRLAAITADLDRLGLAFERIKAIDGRELQDDLGPEPLLNLAEKACVLSHAKALRRLLESDHPAALILEDDAELGEGLMHLCYSVDWWPAGVSLLKVCRPYRRSRLMGPVAGQTPDGRDLREIIRWAPSAAAYIVNREAARRIVTACEGDRIKPFDVMIYDLRESALARALRAMQVDPACARQRKEEFSSDITPSRLLRRRRRKDRSIPYRFRLWWRWMSGRAQWRRVAYCARIGATVDQQDVVG